RGHMRDFRIASLPIVRLVRAIEMVLVIVFCAYVANVLFGFGSPELDSFFNTTVYVGLIAASAVLVTARAITFRGERAGWICIAVGLITTVFAEFDYSVVMGDQADIPIPSLADAGWLLTYPVWCLGLALVIGSRVRRFRSEVWLDAGIVALVMGALTAAFVAP